MTEEEEERLYTGLCAEIINLINSRSMKMSTKIKGLTMAYCLVITQVKLDKETALNMINDNYDNMMKD